MERKTDYTPIKPGWFDNNNFLQNVEYVLTPTQQYLRIQKNACSYINDVIKSNSTPKEYKISRYKIPNIISWSVIRDPYERFLSGLAYDLYYQYPKPLDLDKFFSKINLKNLFLGKHNYRLNRNGNVPHTHLQSLYLFNRNLDFYVDIKDLDVFLRMHFKSPPLFPSTRNKGDIQTKTLLEDYINANPNLKSKIQTHLSLDYYLINELYNHKLVWEFQQGKFF